MRRNIQLIVADMDGTLVNEERQMLPETREALNNLHKQGVLFGIATGRPLGEVMYAVPKKWGLDFEADMFIGMNGGHLFDKKTNCFEKFNELQPETLKELIDFMKPFHVNPFVYVGENQLVAEYDKTQEETKRRHNISIRIADKIEELYEEARPNILFRLYADEDMKKVEEHVAKHPSDIYVGFKTQFDLMEFQDKKLNKGATLEYYSKKFSIPLENIMAFGDTTNDNELLKRAGVGVCMKNGTSDTKACADFVTEYTNDEDGVGKFLKEYFK